MKLLDLESALNLDHKKVINYYKNHVNKGLLFAFRILGYNKLDVVKAKGCFLFLQNGTKILDMTAGIGVLALGHNHENIIKAEQKCHDLNIVDSQKFGPNKLQAALAYNFSQLLPENLNVCFFSVSGAEANEAAIKLATIAQGKKRKYFISTTNAYHGKTHGALSFSNTENVSEGFHIGINRENVIEIQYNDISAYENIIKRYGKEKIIAIILEPIQGHDISVPDRGYLKQICEISKNNNILTIFDEIKCGLGRTGKLFEFFSDQCVPDMLTVSKALGGGKNAIGAMISKKNVFLKAYGSVKDSTIHTTTFFGLGEACATAIETLNIISDEKFLTSINEKSNLFFYELNRIKKTFPKYIKNIRGKGLFIGIQFNFEKIISLGLIKFNIPYINNVKAILMGALVREYISKYNILVHFNKSSPDVLLIIPPLIIDYKEIKYFIRCTEKILEKGFLNLFSKFIVKNITNN